MKELLNLELNPGQEIQLEYQQDILDKQHTVREGIGLETPVGICTDTWGEVYGHTCTRVIVG